jgi:ParB family chromosome partitioning protein
MNRIAFADAEHALDQIIDVQERFDQAVPIDMLVESGHNARRKFDPTKLQELADSIRQHGVVEPLIARPFELFGEPKLEIVAGARRARASRLAGRTHVPVLIREYTDNDVLELHIVENLQREGLDPLDEAASYAALIKSDKDRYSVGYIAHRIGRKEAYVWETLRLLNLVEGAKQLLEQGRITRSHGEAIARLTPEQQEKLIHPDGGLWTGESHSLGFNEGAAATDDPFDGLKAISIRELEAYIANHVRIDVKHAAAVAPLEFAETAARVEEAMAKPGRGKKVISITHLSHVPADAKDENERTFTAQCWERADGKDDSKTCEYSVLGVVAVGEGQGDTFDVCIAKDKCDVHWKSERLAKAKVQKLKDSGQSEKAKEIETKRQEAEAREGKRQDEARAQWKAAYPLILDAVVVALKRLKPARLAPVLLEAVDHSYKGEFGKAARERIPAKTKADDIIRQAVLIVLIRESSGYNAAVTFPRIAKQFGLDVPAILKNIAKQQSAKGTK